MGQNFRRFRGWPKICENKTHELGILVEPSAKLLSHGISCYVRIWYDFGPMLDMCVLF